ncbi:MAG: aconitate hydratase, partial [Chloroflexi bacterium]|nr:aconitate hydratase [Chloroflexota bacterium]
MTTPADPFEARTTLDSGSGPVAYYSLERLGSELGVRLSQLPYTIRILLENALRHCGQGTVTEDEVRAIAGWSPEELVGRDIPFMPGRVLMQDFTGVPAIVDMAAMRAEVHRLGGDPSKINPLVPIDLVIDHSVQVDLAGTREALARNVEMEYQRNGERYAFLRWAQGAFDNLRVVPPGAG